MSLSKYIVFEDKNLLIINKPSGLLSERSGDDTRPSLDQQVEKYLDNKLPAMAVNRLDKDTSGLIIFAKTTFAATEMSKVLADHTIAEKHYLALVKGVITESGIIEAPSRKSFERKKMVIAPLKSGAKLATTKYQVVENFQKYTLLNVQLLTGRTHQIRAHMSYMRHHIVGDSKYGDYKINNEFKRKYNLENQFLHAYKLVFCEVEGYFNYLCNREFSSPLPHKLATIIAQLNRY